MYIKKIQGRLQNIVGRLERRQAEHIHTDIRIHSYIYIYIFYGKVVDSQICVMGNVESAEGG